MFNKSSLTIATMGIDIGKNAFHVVGLDRRGAIVLRQRSSRGQVEARLANMPPCLIGREACVGAHHLSRRLQSRGHDAHLMSAKYVRPYSKGQKNRQGPDGRGRLEQRDPQRVSLAYTEDSRWRNRVEFIDGRAEIVAFLTRKCIRNSITV